MLTSAKPPLFRIMTYFKSKTIYPHAGLARPFWHQALLYLALIGYVVLIGYGSLYPFANWTLPSARALIFLISPWPQYVTRTDITTNILVYVPLGFLLGVVLRNYMGMRLTLFWATTLGLSLSVVMELLQMLLPSRDASNVDMLTNTLGTLLGAMFARVMEKHTWPGKILFTWRKQLFLPGTWVNTGLVLLGIWALSQLSLQAPSLVAGNLHIGFNPFWETRGDFSLARLYQAIIYMLEITALGLFVAVMIRPHHRMTPLVIALFVSTVLLKFLAAALLLKFSVLARLLSIEALLGLLAGFALLYLLLQRRRRPFGAAIIILACFVAVKTLYWLANPETVSLVTEWPAWKNNMLNVTGLASFFSDIWPFLAIAHMLVGSVIARWARLPV